MGKHFTYLPYEGVGNYAYVGCASTDETIASGIADLLGARGFHLYCNNCGGKYSPDPGNIANAITHCTSAIIFLSKQSMESLAFRNTINYILALRLPLICVKIGEFQLAHGLDMQLANCKMLPYTNPEEIVNKLLESGLLTQAMIGDAMDCRTFHKKRTVILLSMIAAAICIFALSVGLVIEKRTSAAYVLQNVDGSDYVNIAKYGEEGIAALAGKHVGELDLSGGEFHSLIAIREIAARTVNVSGIGKDVALWPLCQISGIKTVKITQEQIIYARDLCDSGITVIITS